MTKSQEVAVPPSLLKRPPSDTPIQFVASLSKAMAARIKGLGTGFLTGSYGSGTFGGLGSSGVAGDSEELTNPYKQEPRVFAAVDLLSMTCGGVPLRVYQGDPEDGATEVGAGDPVFDLLNRPNPVLDGALLRVTDAIHLSLTGESLWFLCDRKGAPVRTVGQGPEAMVDLPEEIWSIPGGDRVRLETDKTTKLPAFWSVPTVAGTRRFPSGAVVQFYERPDLDRPFRGLGRVAAIYGPTAQNHLARRYQSILLKNLGDPGNVVVVGGWVSSQELELMRAEIDEEWNDPDRAGETRLLTGDAKYVPGKATPASMQYKDLLKENKGDIAEVFQTPGALLGEDVANYATFSGHMRIYLFLRVEPHLRALENRLNGLFFPRLLDPQLRKYQVRFDLEPVKRAVSDVIEQATALHTLVQSGIPMESALRMVGAPIPDGLLDGGVSWIDQGKQPSDLVILTSRAQAATALVAAGVDPAAALRLAGIEAPLAALPEPAEVEDEEEELGLPGDVVHQLALDWARTMDRQIMSAVAQDRTRVRALDSKAERAARWVGIEKVRKRHRAAVDRGLKAVLSRMRNEQIRALARFAEDGVLPERGLPVYETPLPALSRAEVDSLFLAVEADRLEEGAIRQSDPESLVHRVQTCTGPVEWRLPFAPRTSTWIRRHPRLRDVPVRRLRDVAYLSRGDLSEDEIDALLTVNRSKWVDALAGKLEPSLGAAYADAARGLARELGVEIANLTPTGVLEALRAQAVEVVEGAQSVIAQRMRSDLIRVMSESTELGTLQSRVEASLKELKATTTKAFRSHSARALTIARTEVGKATASSRYKHLEDLFNRGIIESIRWLTRGGPPESQGGIVRDAHYAVDGAIRVPGEAFYVSSNGTPMIHPKAPGAAAEDVINCGCDLASERADDPEQQPPDENELEGIVRSVEDEIRVKRVEYGRVVDPLTGKVVWQKRGDKASITFDTEEAKGWRGKVFTHNHPGGWGFPAGSKARGGTSLSAEDVFVAVRYQLAEIRAVSPGWRHVMRPKAGGGWPDLDDLRSKVQATVAVLRDEARAKFLAVAPGAARDEMRKQLTDELNANFMHDLWARIASDLGLVYRRIDFRETL